jgi:hypothetical protein
VEDPVTHPDRVQATEVEEPEEEQAEDIAKAPPPAELTEEAHRLEAVGGVQLECSQFDGGDGGIGAQICPSQEAPKPA